MGRGESGECSGQRSTTMSILWQQGHDLPVSSGTPWPRWPRQCQDFNSVITHYCILWVHLSHPVHTEETYKERLENGLWDPSFLSGENADECQAARDHRAPWWASSALSPYLHRRYTIEAMASFQHCHMLWAPQSYGQYLGDAPSQERDITRWQVHAPWEC